MPIDETKLKRMVEERKAQARPLYIMAKAVATECGNREPKKHGAMWYFHDEANDLHIAWDDYGANLDVKHKGRRVLGVHLGDIVAYLPSKIWEDILRKHHATAKVSINADEAMKMRKRIADAEEKWAIQEKDIGVGDG